MKVYISLIVLLVLSTGIVSSFSSWQGHVFQKPVSYERLGKRAKYDSCDWAEYTESRRAYLSGKVSEPVATNKPIRGRRLIVHGDFNGDKVEETLTECFRDAKNKETHKFLENRNYEAVVDDLAKRAPLSFMLSSNPKIDTFQGRLLTFGFAHAQNLGNVDGQKGDELLVVYDWCDWSTLNQARVFSLKKDGWEEIASWLIRDMWVPNWHEDSEGEQVYAFDYRDAKGYGLQEPKDVDWCTPVETNQLIIKTLNEEFSGLKDSVLVLN